jgi:2-methylcitrate dehydratase PrpD
MIPHNSRLCGNRPRAITSSRSSLPLRYRMRLLSLRDEPVVYNRNIETHMPTTSIGRQLSPPTIRGGLVPDRRITEELVAFCAQLSPSTVPAEALEAARGFALDFAGVALRGSLEQSSQSVASTVARLGVIAALGAATMIGNPLRTRPQYAALLNGTSAHGLELDDIHPEAGVHVASTIFATAFAVGEQVEAHGADVLAAVVAGYEIACRVAIALPLTEHSNHGFHSTGTCGVFGAAMTASRLLALTPEQTTNALGIAGSQAAGSLEFQTEGAQTKRLHPGWASHSGIIAAELARGGLTGPHRILEGRSGFFRSYSDSPRAEEALTGLGSDFHILRTAIKPHAACRYSQGAIDGLLDLVLRHDVRPEAIERITLGLFKAAFPVVVEPFERKRRPQAVVDAQFSVYFAAAAAVLWGRVSVAEYQPNRLFAPELHAMIDRVDCVVAPELDNLFPKSWPTKVEIALKDGRRLQTRIDRLKGDPENALAWNELVSKFDDLAGALFPPAHRATIVSAAEDLFDRPIGDFVRLLSMPN